MVAINDFSGLMSSDWALASALAIAPIDSLERCMIALRPNGLETDGARFRALGTHPMADRLLGIFRHESLQLSLGTLMFQECPARTAEDAGKLRPGIGRTHVDDADRLN